MALKDTENFLKENDIDNVRMIIVDINGTPLGKRLPPKKFLMVCEHGMSFSSGIFNLLIDSDIIPELDGAGGFSSGFPDVVAWPDLNTLRLVPWETRTAMVICDVLNRDGTEIPYDARTVLKKQVEKMKSRPFGMLAGMEYEFYALKETSDSLAEKNWNNR